MNLIDIHTHGGFGVNFNTCTKDELIYFANKICNHSVVAFLPTLYTDTFENLTRQLTIVRDVMLNTQTKAKILGVHLEANFLNAKKTGIHKLNLLVPPSVDVWCKYFEEFNDIIKIVTLAPELDDNNELQKYLLEKNIKIQAGHSVSDSLKLCSATTHHFNAMPQMHHREETFTLDALINDDIYTEIIADIVHTSSFALKLLLKAKQKNKVLFISDSLPISHSGLDEINFCSQTIYKNGKNSQGTLAGSVNFLEDIVQNLIKLNIIDISDVDYYCYKNQLEYLGINEI